MKKETQRSLILQKQRPSERPATSKDGGLLPLLYFIRGEMESISPGINPQTPGALLGAGSACIAMYSASRN